MCCLRSFAELGGLPRARNVESAGNGSILDIHLFTRTPHTPHHVCLPPLLALHEARSWSH